jgi:glycosyltransferase involved in cell wall biosynthesis
MRNPIVSVVLPVYNAEKYLKESIESILNQSFRDLELIIINDGSKDLSQRIIDLFKDERIVKIDQENVGLASALNTAFQVATGKYIARMDADDISLPDRIQMQYNFMELNTDIGIVGSWVKCFGNSNKVFKTFALHDEILTSMLFDSAIAHPTFFIRKNILDQNKVIYRDNFRGGDYYFCEDYDFVAQLIGKTKFANIPKVLLLYRVHNEAISAVNNFNARKKGRIWVNNLVFSKFFGQQLSNEENNTLVNFTHDNYDLTYSQLGQISNLLLKIIVLKEKPGYKIALNVIIRKVNKLTIKTIKSGSIRLFTYALFIIFRVILVKCFSDIRSSKMTFRI